MKTKILLIVFSVMLLKTSAQTWAEATKIVSSDRFTNDEFGFSVAISGNYAIVGARLEDHDSSGNNAMSQAGAAYIFERDTNGNWLEAQKIVASDRSSNDVFGTSVSISGDYAIVGAPEHVAGAVYVFKRDTSGNWSEVQKIEANDASNNDLFGFSVSISGSNFIVGAYNEEENEFGGSNLHEAGSAYIFTNNSGVWVQTKKLVASDRDEDDWFGFSVAIDGDYAIVGTYKEEEDASGVNTFFRAGSAYIFEKTNGVWAQTQKIVATDRDEDDEFGYAVSINGGYALIGANAEEEDANNMNNLSSSGSAYIFERAANGSWNQTQKIVPSDRALGDNFGSSVSISNDKAIIGAYKEDEDASGNNTLTNPGSAYVFEKDINDNWVETQKLVASDREGQDSFASTVAISDNYAIVGAHLEDDDLQGNNGLNAAGSTYIFESSGSLNDLDYTFINKISIYPNPTSSKLFIKAIKDKSDYKIFDITGKLISVGVVLKAKNHINVSNLSNGFYVLNIKQENIIYNYKFLKMH